jgi:hypothetical protein
MAKSGGPPPVQSVVVAAVPRVNPQRQQAAGLLGLGAVAGPWQLLPALVQVVVAAAAQRGQALAQVAAAAQQRGQALSALAQVAAAAAQ